MVASQKRSRAAFQFYPADFLASSKVARMSTMEIGAYFTLLCYAWTDNGLPAQIDQLAKLLRMPSGRFKKLWAGVLSECFEERQGRLVNPRQERQRKELEDYISACERGGRRSADSRSKRYGSSQPVHSDSRSEPRSERRSEHRSGVEVAPNTSSSSSSVQQESLASLAPVCVLPERTNVTKTSESGLISSLASDVPRKKEEQNTRKSLSQPSLSGSVAVQASIHPTHHRAHAACGRVCVPAFLHDEFRKRRNHDNADMELRDWYLVIDAEWAIGGPKADQEPGEPLSFWRARYEEHWPSPAAGLKQPAWMTQKSQAAVTR